MQEELQGADDKRKARFAKMKASYDAQLEERDATIREAEQKLVSYATTAAQMRISMQYLFDLLFALGNQKVLLDCTC
jgi:hypothetical protein